MKKRIAALLLTLVMMLSLFPTTVFAAGRTGQIVSKKATISWTAGRRSSLKGMQVSVTGAGLSGKRVNVEALEGKEAQMYFDAIEAEGNTLINPMALDITIVDNKTGEEVQPFGDVNVAIKKKNATLDSTVYHFVTLDAGEQQGITPISDLDGLDGLDADAPELTDDGAVVAPLTFEALPSSTDGDTATVTTKHFSVYVVDETVSPRLTVKFMNGTAEIASMIVKAADTDEELETIVYDPSGSMDLHDGEVFKGWTTESAYTTETELLSIEQVRAAVKTRAASITADTTVTYYAANFKSYVITYLSDDESPITVGTAAVDYPAYNAAGYEVSYTVNMGYTVDDKHNFEGWTADETSQDHIKNYPTGAASETVVEDGTSATVHYYPNNTEITITGDITFTVRAPEGAWLVFDETCNGTVKGATYTAPQFVLKGDATQEPSTLASMQCYGYTFGGWYDTAEHALAHAADPSVTTGAFSFGSTLETGTTIYASWIPNTTANYTVLIWKQNIAGNGYDFVESKILTGTVGQTVNSIVQVGSEDDAYATINGATYSYTGFHLGRFDSDVVIVPEGNAVVNVYFDRNTYVLTFEVQRTSGTQYRYTRDDDGDWGYVDGTWVQLGSEVTSTETVTLYHLSQYETHYDYSWCAYTDPVYSDQNGTIANSPTYPNTYYRWSDWRQAYVQLYWHTETVTYETKAYTYTDPVDGSEKTYTGPRFSRTTVNSGSGWYTVQTIVALYEQNIADYFPIVGTNGVTYDNGERWDPQSTSGENDVIVVLEIMPGHDEVFHLNTATRPLKTLIYYVEALPGATETVEAPNTLYNYNNQAITAPAGKTYVEYMTVEARYNGATIEDFLDLTGFDRIGCDCQRSSGGFYNYDEDNDGTVCFYYSRQSFVVNYMDGIYVDGNNNTIQTRTSNQLTTSELIAYDASLADCDITPTLPTGEEGYVFEGWYMDEACTSEYDFEHSTMPLNGVKVYAKWRQIQYRVFLHTGLTEIDDTNLTWGSDNQSLSFRIGYGGTVSTPTGQRNGYNFLGWYTAETGGSAWTDSTKLNSTTVTTDYDKETTPTDPETKDEADTPWYGPWDVETEGARNSDLTGYNGEERFWITKQLDLYARWSKVLDGADGINVVYNAVGFDMSETPASVSGTGAPTDNAIYIDNSPVTAGVSATAPTGYVFDHWVVCTWNGSAYSYDANSVTVLPGMTFTIHAEDAKVEAVGDTNTYTVQLLAIYKAVEEKTPTHIAWYSNYGDSNEGKGELYRYDKKDNEGHDTLQINEAVTIYGLADSESVPTRTGYTFKGWTKTQGGTTADFLIWDGTQYKTASGKVATQVAADEKDPIEDLYAVWEGFFYVYHTGSGLVEKVLIPATGKYDITQNLTAGTLYGGYFEDYSGKSADFDVSALQWNEDNQATDTGCTVYDGLSATATFNTAYQDPGLTMVPEAETVYYVKEVPDNLFLKPYFHYTYHKADGVISSAWLISNIDTADYQKVGFVITSANKNGAICQSLTVQTVNGGTSVRLTPKRLFSINSGYLTYLKVIDATNPVTPFGAGATVLQYWVTPDGLIVTGTTQRTYQSITNKSDFAKGSSSVEETSVPSTIALYSGN